MFTLKNFCGSSLNANNYYSSWKIFVRLIFEVWLNREIILTANNTRTMLCMIRCLHHVGMNMYTYIHICKLVSHGVLPDFTAIFQVVNYSVNQFWLLFQSHRSSVSNVCFRCSLIVPYFITLITCLRPLLAPQPTQEDSVRKMSMAAWKSVVLLEWNAPMSQHLG